MATFSLEKIHEVSGKIEFSYLIRDGENAYREFEDSIKREGQYARELITLQTRMLEIANCQTLPQDNSKTLRPNARK